MNLDGNILKGYVAGLTKSNLCKQGTRERGREIRILCRRTIWLKTERNGKVHGTLSLIYVFNLPHLPWCRLPALWIKDDFLNYHICPGHALLYIYFLPYCIILGEMLIALVGLREIHSSQVEDYAKQNRTDPLWDENPQEDGSYLGNAMYQLLDAFVCMV